MISRIGRQQEGSALIIAILAMAIMLSVGLATLSFGAGQRQLTAGERIRESTFTVAEAALNAQIFQLGQSWPGSAATQYPAGCSSSTTTTNCPDPATINAQFTGTDYTGNSWATVIQDNNRSDYYSSSVQAGQPTYDADGDGKVWVRAQATLRGVRRAVVTQVKTQVQTIPFPRNALTAGYFATTNNGRKVIIDTNGSTYSSTPTQPGSVAVRCSSGPKSSCLDYDASKGQVSPPTYQTNYPAAPLVTSDQLNAMRGIAKTSNTYYSSGCPSSLTGALVFIENGTCSFNTGTFNTLASPGMVVLATGTLTLGGNATYHGLVYAANLQNSTGYVVSFTGCAKMIGSLAVDGPGGVLAGSCGTNIAFNPNVTSLARGYGQPAPVKATWREVGT
jgi:Tfp pilus assembly protein PilX